MWISEDLLKKRRLTAKMERFYMKSGRAAEIHVSHMTNFWQSCHRAYCSVMCPERLQGTYTISHAYQQGLLCQRNYKQPSSATLSVVLKSIWGGEAGQGWQEEVEADAKSFTVPAIDFSNLILIFAVLKPQFLESLWHTRFSAMRAC